MRGQRQDSVERFTEDGRFVRGMNNDPVVTMEFPRHWFWAKGDEQRLTWAEVQDAEGWNDLNV